MNKRDRAKILEAFRIPGFLPGQEEVIDHIRAGRNIIANMKVGGGKSLCYQAPAVLDDRLVVVVSPLIALMNDQVRGLQKRGINAATLNSSQEHSVQYQTVKDLLRGDL